MSFKPSSFAPRPAGNSAASSSFKASGVAANGAKAAAKSTAAGDDDEDGENDNEDGDNDDETSSKRWSSGGGGADMMEDDEEIDDIVENPSASQPAPLISTDWSSNFTLSGGGAAKWARPNLPHIDPKKDSVAIQQLEADYYVAGLCPADLPRSTAGHFVSNTTTSSNSSLSSSISASGENHVRRAVIRLYGVTALGNSVLLHIHNFQPYFYVPAWPNMTLSDVELFQETLNSELKSAAKINAVRNLERYVLCVDVERKQSIWGYHFGEQCDFLKVTMAVPPLVATARRLLERGMTFPQRGHFPFTTYESNLPYVLRYMVDKDIRGGGWIEVPAGAYLMRSMNQRVSHAQLELDLDWSVLIAHEPVGEWLKLAPLRILSLDIECAGRKGHFPKPDTDPVIMIASVAAVFGGGQQQQQKDQEKSKRAADYNKDAMDVEKPAAAASSSQAKPSSSSSTGAEPFVQAVFTLKSCASIVGAHVIPSEKEEDLLMRWLSFFIAIDPDVITGYNIINFDLPYLLDRAKTLKVKNFPFLGRIRNSQSTMKDTRFSSKAYGTRENKEIKMEGRVQFDLLDVIRRDFKLRSYTLNSVCAHFLQQQKEDVHYSIITDLQNGNEETRRRLAVYCLKDSMLPIRLMDKLMCIINFIEMGRVTGVPISYLLTRGQQIKVLSQLYRKAKQRNFVVPVKKDKPSDEKYEGATVIEPKRGYYSMPIATLDFTSLYPSIMMAHNLCYSTLISGQGMQRLKELKPEDWVKTPTGDIFVKGHVHKGLLPEIFIELLDARSNAKKMMKDAQDPFVAAVLNGRQLALKISANSVYGFTGAQVGQLPCLPISSSVTAFGRQMIEHTKKVVESTYTKKNGHQYDAEVIYGDTDSVMVKFGPESVSECMKIGAEAAAQVTKEFIKPIKLEFEKVYYPYLLMNKKRYAGLYWTNPNTWEKLDTKGIETVRRDSASLVSNVVTECLNVILIDKSVQKAVEYAKSVIADLLCNNLDLSLLVISKSLGKNANNDDYVAKQAHVELAKRMRQRDPSTAPSVGDRVAYIITKAARGAAAYEKAEDPIFVLENDVPIDTEYYLKNQLQQPLTRIFEPILGVDGIKSLFAGEHTLKIKNVNKAVGGLMKFTVKTRRCLVCSYPLAATEKVLCKNCQPQEQKIYMKQVEKVRDMEDLYGRLWTQCQRCQGSLHQDVLCTSKDCPIFYRRKKVQKDVREAENILEQFSNLELEF